MTSDVFLDTNILLYALVPESTLKHDPRIARAEELLGAGGTVSVQVINEFSDVAFRKLHKDCDGIAELLKAVEVLCGPAISLTSELLKAALTISGRYGFRIYDSLILAAADEAGCATVYTEDLQHGQVVGGLTIINPFL